MNDRPYITCRELIAFLLEYLAGELPPEREAEFERHLSVCPQCVQYLKNYKATVAMAKAAETAPQLPVADVVDDVLAAVMAAMKTS
jgi:anti-sigma factor RsiW